jgi:hypothetical protein
MAQRDFVFTITTGRSGTAFLAELLAANLPNADTHHEILGWDQFGVNTPEVSHMTLFNSQGNVEKVQDFWRQKLRRIAQSSAGFYVETSHLLAKAGLIENLAPLSRIGRIHLILLERDTFATIKSFRSRFDFENPGNMWMWYLDPNYPRNLCNSAEMVRLGVNGICLWYICEMRLRAAYYEKLLTKNPAIVFHRTSIEQIAARAGAAQLLSALGAARSEGDVVLPKPQNVEERSVAWIKGEPELLREVIAKVQFDAGAMAQAALDRGMGFEPAKPNSHAR